MTLLFIIAIVLVVALVGSLPTWPRSRNWGYYPISGVSAVILVLLILFFACCLRVPDRTGSTVTACWSVSEGHFLRLQRSCRTNRGNCDLVKFELVSAIIGFPETPIAERNRGDGCSRARQKQARPAR